MLNISELANSLKVSQCEATKRLGHTITKIHIEQKDEMLRVWFRADAATVMLQVEKDASEDQVLKILEGPLLRRRSNVL